MELEIKVIIKDGIVEAVLKNQSVPVRVEVIDINKDYRDYVKLQNYADSVYKNPLFENCDFTVADFCEEQ